MDKEKIYKEALLHVIGFIEAGGGLEMLKPLNASYANDIAQMCKNVINGDTVEEAIHKLKG